MENFSKNVDVDVDRFTSKGYLKTLKGTYTLLISPELAEVLLQYNTSNRPLRQNHIREFSKRMANGEWVLNGQPIIFSKTGILLDGQYRLNSVINCGIEQWFDVKFGVNENVFSTLDDGKKRTLGDVLHVNNVANESLVASAVRMICGIKDGRKSQGGGGRTGRPSNKELLEWYYGNPGILEHCTVGERLYRVSGGLISKTKFAAFSFLMSEINEVKADEFLTTLANGANLTPNSPIFKLRARLMRAKINKSHKMAIGYERALIIKAWNFYIEGKSPKLLKYTSDTEEYPMI